MLQLVNYLKHFFAIEEGQTLSEFALFLVVIGVVAVIAVTALSATASPAY